MAESSSRRGRRRERGESDGRSACKTFPKLMSVDALRRDALRGVWFTSSVIEVPRPPARGSGVGSSYDRVLYIELYSFERDLKSLSF